MAGRRNRAGRKSWLLLFLSFLGLNYIIKKFKLDE